jgi:hypothetical protein
MEALGIALVLFLSIGLAVGWLFLLLNIGSFSIAGRWVIGVVSVVILYLLFISGGFSSDCPDPSECRWGR